MKKTLTLAATITLLSLITAFRPSGTTGYAVGDTAADFKLKNVDGKMVSLADYKQAKGYIVIFTCNHCPYSKAYEDRIIALHKKYEKEGYPVVAINSNDKVRQPEDSYENMQQRAKQKKFRFAYLYDETQEVALQFGATRTPHVFILDKALKVQYIGAIDDNHEEPASVKEKYVEKALNELMAGKPVSQSLTKALGCTIKWKNK